MIGQEASRAKERGQGILELVPGLNKLISWERPPLVHLYGLTNGGKGCIVDIENQYQYGSTPSSSSVD